MTLTAVSRSLSHHYVLAVALAAVLCHSQIAHAFLEASKTRPGQKRDKGQGYDSRSVQAMSCVLRHGALPTFLRIPHGRVNPS